MRLEPGDLELTGGVTGAVRRGDTVRRSAGSWTAAVHALMVHARANGVPEAPEVLGTDEAAGAEVLKWIAGDQIEGTDLGDDSRMVEVGALVRRVHDALATFRPPAPAAWRLRHGGPAFVHGDISPWNVVVRAGRIVGLLDWDQGGPGRWLEDLAYAAWVWVPLERPEHIPSHWLVADPSLEGQCRRLRLLVDSFGLDGEQRATFLSEVAHVQATYVGRIAQGVADGDPGMDNVWWGGRRIGVFGQAMMWLNEHWRDFEQALTDPKSG